MISLAPTYKYQTLYAGQHQCEFQLCLVQLTEYEKYKMDTCRNGLLGLLLIAAVCVAAPSVLPPSINSRVVNGTNALPNEFPFAASLRNRIGSHTCGASIIHEEWVMTAAHCIFSTNPNDFSVQYGSNEISQNGDFIAKVKRVILHQGYDDNKSFVHDIALVQLMEPIVFSAGVVEPVTLPDYLEMVDGGVTAQLIGWGFNEVGPFVICAVGRV